MAQRQDIEVPPQTIKRCSVCDKPVPNVPKGRQEGWRVVHVSCMEKEGHTPSKDPVPEEKPQIPPEQRINALEAQLSFSHGYIKFIESQLKRIIGEFSENDDVQMMIGKFLTGWRIIQDENAAAKAQKEIDDEAIKNLKDDVKDAEYYLTRLIPTWKDWDDTELCLLAYERDQKLIREDVQNLQAQVRSLRGERPVAEVDLTTGGITYAPCQENAKPSTR